MPTAQAQTKLDFFDTHSLSTTDDDFEDVAKTLGFVTHIVLPCDWGSIEETEGIFDFTLLDLAVSKWNDWRALGNNLDDLHFVLRIVAYDNPEGGGIFVGAPAWIYTTTDPVTPIELDPGDPNTPILPQAWSSAFRSHYLTFVDGVVDHALNELGLGDGDFLWVTGGELAYTNVFGAAPWAQVFERESSGWSPCVWQENQQAI